MKYHSFLRTVILALLTLIGQNLFSFPLSTPDTVTLQLRWKHQFQFAGYYAAIQEGYYEEKGLNVVLKEGWPGIELGEELTSGRADFAVHLPGMLLDRQEGKPVVALAAIFQHSPLALFVGGDSGIQNPHNLVGKKLMMRLNGNIEIYAMLEAEGVDRSQIEIVPQSWNYDDLISGKVDAMTGYLTDIPYFLNKRGYDYRRILPITYGIDFYGDCLFTTEEEIEKHPGRVEDFLSASIKGWDYAMAHPEEIIDLIISKYNPQLSKEELLYEAGAMGELVMPELMEIGHMNLGRWERMAASYVSLGLLPPDYSLDGFLYIPGQLHKERFRRFVFIMIIAVSAIIIIALSLLFFNYNLRQQVALRTRELEKEKKFSDAVINSLPGLFYVYEEGKRLVRWNKMVPQVSGLTDKELLGYSVLGFTPEQDKERVSRLVEQLFATGESVSTEASLLFKGKEIPYLHSIALLKGEEKNYVVGVSLNLSEKRKLEDQLRQAQKMESVGRLAGGIAHDFNNILMVILGYSELLLAQMGEDSPYLEKINLIHSAGERASALVRQLLAFSRKQILEKRAVNINTVINDMLQILSKTLGEDVIIKTFPGADVSTIEADVSQIEQILMNLAVNARDAMPEGGEIVIETKNVVLDRNYVDAHVEIKPGNYVQFTVSDNGEGMSPEVCEHLFDPFFTTKEQGKGTGLGLSTVYGIVKQHNGYIYVYSEKGRGTTFKLYFPVSSRGVETGTSENTPVSQEPSSGTILVVDDEPLVRQFIVDTLSPLGYRCIEASDGMEAQEKFRDNSSEIDLLLTDVIMPRMGGRDLAKGILGEKPDLKVIFMSGYTENTISHLDELDGDIHFIFKPVSAVSLSDKVRKVLLKG